MSNNNQIILDVTLDENKIPEKILWTATTAEDAKDTPAFFLSLFDPERKDTLKIDLWTKEMSIGNMELFMFNTLKSMGRSYAKAVGQEDAVSKFDAFADELFIKKDESK